MRGGSSVTYLHHPDHGLEESREYVKKGRTLPKGVICPCCRQLCKDYKRKLNSGMAVTMIWLVRAYAKNNRWIHVQKEAPRKVVRSNEIGKLAHWGLVVLKPSDKESKKSSGMWMPTKKGISFVHRNTIVPSHVHLYNNEVIGWAEKKVDIVECLSNPFNYEELMHGPE